MVAPTHVRTNSDLISLFWHLCAKKTPKKKTFFLFLSSLTHTIKCDTLLTIVENWKGYNLNLTNNPDFDFKSQQTRIKNYFQQSYCC